MTRRDQSLVLLLLTAIAVPATAHTFGFSIGAAAPAACLAVGDATYRIAATGDRADYTVRIDPAAAAPDIRVQIAETPDTADFAFIDDGEAAPRCRKGHGSKSVRIDPAAPSPDLVLGFATSTMPANYQIYVRSRRLAPETAAALFAVARMSRTIAGRTGSNTN